MDAAEIRTALDDTFDTALIHFGFADYMRDFQMYFQYANYNAVLKYRFVNCVVADCSTGLAPLQWLDSLDERLIGPHDQVGEEPINGWVWATRWAQMYPGATLLESSDEADRWSKALGRPFYEVVFDAPPMSVRLVFSDLVVEEAAEGESPFTV